MTMQSLWRQNASFPTFSPLAGDTSTDVLIIGGGIAGILITHTLTKRGIDCLLVEADTLCCGVSENTTAKITSQHGLIYHQILKTYGKEKARLYLDANERALSDYRALAQTIDCDFEEADNYVYSLDDRRALEDELKALDTIGYSADFTEDLPLPFKTAGAIRFSSQAQFHPLRFLGGIAEGLKICEHTKIRELQKTVAITDRGKIHAKKIIIATHFPILNKHGGYYLKLYQHRSYVLSIKNAPFSDGMYVDASDTGLSFRCYQDQLLIGGGSHRTGKKGGNWQELKEFVRRHYPDARITHQWATQDCMSLDRIPYIGQYSKNTPELFVATGFNKWGMTSSMVAANLLADLIQERTTDEAKLFSPQRRILHPQLVINVFEACKGLLTPTTKRCPHLGCALHWNAAEHTWDCSCHGSRFAADGALINNPATDDLKRPPEQP